MVYTSFADLFSELTGHEPFLWQSELWRILAESPPDDWPRTVDVPTGLGKTSILAIWLIARLRSPLTVPTRLVYVVNRRTVVDQTTAEAERLRSRLAELDLPGFPGLAISTLRGQFADNRAWLADPARPAIICGTVDMIGSRLLFGGYGIGFKSRPLHAGFLGQDALLVHDEAHLEPAFEALLESIVREQQQQPALPWPKLHALALTATRRNNTSASVAGITQSEVGEARDPAAPVGDPLYEVGRRLRAPKQIRFHSQEDDKTAEQLAALALAKRETDRAVVVFARRVEDVERVAQELEREKLPTATLTGTMRGRERDQLLRTNPVFARFMGTASEASTASGTVYLVATSAGEVGIDLNAHDMVCDLTTYDSMAQRFGRVNRRGEFSDSTIDIVHPKRFDAKKSEMETRREATLALLTLLPNNDACPLNLRGLPPEEVAEAFSPIPVIPPTSDILFDKWAMTSIREAMPGRPPLAPYLHGLSEWEPPRTVVAWREEVGAITQEVIDANPDGFLDELLADYPLKPHELLSETSERVYAGLKKLVGKESGNTPAWLLGDDGLVKVTDLQSLVGGSKDELKDRILLLPPKAGGLTEGGLFDGTASYVSSRAYDVSEEWRDAEGKPLRFRVWDDEPVEPGMALVRTLDTKPTIDELAPPDDEESGQKSRRFWHWYVRLRAVEDATPAALAPVTLESHVDQVTAEAKALVGRLPLPDDLRQAIVLAAELHDLGKRRVVWQRSIGNPQPTQWYAKGGKPPGAPRWRPGNFTGYRHEFGSLLDALDANQPYRAQLEALSPELQDVVLHLIAAHHGFARPHFLPEGCADPAHDSKTARDAALETMRRYARLQARFGHWGLAYLESLLRSADWAASAKVPNVETER